MRKLNTGFYIAGISVYTLFAVVFAWIMFDTVKWSSERIIPNETGYTTITEISWTVLYLLIPVSMLTFVVFMVVCFKKRYLPKYRVIMLIWLAGNWITFKLISPMTYMVPWHLFFRFRLPVMMHFDFRMVFMTGTLLSIFGVFPRLRGRVARS